MGDVRSNNAGRRLAPIDAPLRVALPRAYGLGLTAVVVASLAGGAAWVLLGAPRFGIDDADITMVYARNLAQGSGYVYRELGERVEGSTSLLWTLVCALWFAFEPTSFASLFWVNATFNCATALGVLVLARRAGAGFSGVVVAASLFAAAAAFHSWSAGTLMDVALWSALVTVTFVALLGRATGSRLWVFALTLVGLVVARPEGFALAPACVCLHGAFCFLLGEAPKLVVRRSGLLLLLVASTIVAITSFRLWYFGYAFPNTYYAKVGADSVYTAVAGLGYVMWFLRRSPLSVLVTLALAYELFQFARMLRSRSRDVDFRPDVGALCRGILALGITLGFSLRLVEGADHFAGHRTLQPFVPLGVALVGSSAPSWLMRVRAMQERTAAFTLVVAVALVPLEWWLFARTSAASIRGEHELAKHQREVGSTLNRVFFASELPSLGVVAAGGVAFTYSGPIYDLLGLNWVKMAHGSNDRVGHTGHAGFSPEVFWQTPVTVVLPDRREALPRSACDLYDEWYDSVLDGLLASPRFREAYRPAMVALPDGYLQFFVRRSFEPEAGPKLQFLPWPDDFPNVCLGSRSE